MFFFDGNEIHVAAIERILQKLRNIIELIKLCDSVRLYCCSLLLVYESDKTAKLNYKVIITLTFQVCYERTWWIMGVKSPRPSRVIYTVHSFPFTGLM